MSANAQEAQRLYEAAMKICGTKDVSPDQIRESMVLLRKAAEMNHPEACEAMFVALSKVDPKEATRWFHRAERAKQGLPNSPATDKTSSGCLGIMVLGFLLLGLGLASLG